MKIRIKTAQIFPFGMMIAYLLLGIAGAATGETVLAIGSFVTSLVAVFVFKKVGDHP